MNLTEEEFDRYVSTATPTRIQEMFHKPRVPKELQFPKIKPKFNGKDGMIFDDWLKIFESKARYVDKQFLVSNLGEE
eukprot:SAG11_NODE_302_length_11005_cov_12.491748_8_plen_77_part_00